MVTYTTTYSFAKPTVGDDEDVWGGYLNGNFDTLESLLKGTTSLTSLSLTGNITFGDNDKAIFGAGSDLQIYHDGSNSVIKDNGTGNLLIQGATDIVLEDTSGANYFRGVSGSYVRLYYNNGTKLETTSTGVDITGTLTSDGVTVDTDTLHVDSTNNRVGIGTTSPDKRLDVLSGTSNSDIAAFTGISTGRGLVISTFANTSDDAGVDFDAISGNGAISFSTGGSEAMRIDSGNLLVGKTSSDISVNGFETGDNGYTKITRTSGTANVNTVLMLNRLNTDGNIAEFRKDGTTVGSIGVSSDKIYIGNGDTGLRFVNTSNEIRPFNTSTLADRDAGFSLGSSGARFTDLHLSGNISVGGTVDGVDIAAFKTAYDSHNHDGRYYTETEADSRFVNVTGDTMTGDLTISSTSPEIKLVDTNSFTDANDRMIFRAGGDNLQWQWFDNSASSTTTLMTLNNVGQLTLGSNTVFHDGYHPNADAWTTARTLSLSGDASGSVSWDGSANATLSVTVANDSHSHSNYITSNANDTGTGGYSTSGTYWEIGNGTGSVAINTNDGQGNANVTFNHNDGVPDIGGNAARIEVNVDSSTNANMNFELKSGVTGGTSVSLTSILNLSESQVTAYKPLDVTGAITASGAISSGGNTVLTTADYDVQVCHLKTNVDASVTQGVANEFTVNFNLEEHNDTSTFSHSSGVVTVATAGWYRIVANLVYENATASARNTIRAYVKKNGTEVTSTATYDYDRGVTYGEFSNNKINTMLYLAANDTIEIANYGENIDGSVTIQSEECEFMVSSETVQASSTNADTVDGLHASSFLRSDADDTFSGNIQTTSTNGIRFGSANQTDANDGYIAAGKFASGLNIVGTQTTAGTGRQVRVWGSLITDGGNAYWHAGNDGSGSGLDADTVDGLQASSFLRSDANDTMTGTLTVDNELRIDNGNSTSTHLNYSNTSVNYIRGTSTIIDTPVTHNGTLTTDGLTVDGTTTLNGTLTLGANVINDVEDIYLRDKLFHDGDTDTYIGFATNTINFSAGGTTEMFINGSGVYLGNSALHEDYDALSGTSVTIDPNTGGAWSLTMTGNTTFTFGGTTSGYSVGLIVQLTGNGGTVTWPSSVDWAGGTAPDAPASGETDIYVFWTRDGGTTWYGVQSIDAAA